MGNPKKNWKLVWSDEFDGKEINKDNWRYELGYVRNNELQEYVDSPENAYIEEQREIIVIWRTYKIYLLPFCSS